MSKKVLIVGGAGYVGGALTDILRDFSFKVYDNLTYEEYYLKPVDFVFGSVIDYDNLIKYLKWADCVVWLAAIVGDGACAIDPTLTQKVNTESVEFLSKNYDRRIIFLSTCSVYGRNTEILYEDSPKNPLSLYAVSKLNAEKFLLNKDALIFRLGTLFGQGDNFSRIRMDLVVNALTLSSFVKNEITVFGGEQFRPVLHVKDVALGIKSVIDSKITGIFNFAKQNVRIIDLAYQVRNHFPDVKVNTVEQLFEDNRNYKVNCEKLKQIETISPTYSIDYGIEEIKYLLETKRIKEIYNPRFSNQTFLKEEILNERKKV